MIYFRNDVKDVTKEYGTHNIHLLESQFLLWKSLVSWDSEEARLMIEKLGCLCRELQLENELELVWLEELKEFVEYFSDYKKRRFEKRRKAVL